MEQQILVFILGVSTMFYGVMAWIFFRRKDRLSSLVGVLMGLMSVQCVKDMAFVIMGIYMDAAYWEIMTSVDVVAVPMYAFILKELVRPGELTWKAIILHEIPFVALASLHLLTGSQLVFDILTWWSAAYGTYILLWTHVNLGRYNKKLKEQFSYTDNIDLSWLRRILIFFYLVLALWVVDSLVIASDPSGIVSESAYLLLSVAMWMIICYFLHRHASVLEGLDIRKDGAEEEDSAPVSDLGGRIERLFTEEKVFLNPDLKLSDIATAVGSNRTYVSNYFNREADLTFYDYVNRRRIDHATRLLMESDDSVMTISVKSGFNSPQSFIRVFTKMKGVSPKVYRQNANG